MAYAMKIYENNNDVLIFASGVSNSSEKKEAEYQREFELLKENVNFPGKIIYFSTISIFDPSLEDTKYVLHKKKIEKYLLENCKSFLVFRLPIIIGKSQNKNTFFNYFKNKLSQDNEVTIKNFSKRYIIDIESITQELPSFINLFNNQFINVTFNNLESVFSIVLKMKEVLKSNSEIVVTNENIQSSYLVDNELFLKFAAPIDENYNENILKKYLNDKNIGILYLCLGKYKMFFKEFYESCEKNFLKTHNKTYYIFTNSVTDETDESLNQEFFDYINTLNKKKVIIVEKNRQGWPNDSYLRFHFFDSCREQLINNHFLYFFNANLVINDEVGEEVFPDKETNFLVGVIHPGFYNCTKQSLPTEKNENSSFYIKDGFNKYFQGCLSGGRAKEYLEMSNILSKKIDLDNSKEIYPVYFDETALNWFYHDKNVLELNPGYSFPEDYILPFDKKITQINKRKVGVYEHD